MKESIKEKIIGVIVSIAIILAIVVFLGGGEKFYINLHKGQYTIDEATFNDKTQSIEPGTYYSNQLIEYERIIYKKFMENKENLKKGDYVIDFGYTFTERLNSKGIPLMSEDGDTLLKNQANDPKLPYKRIFQKLYIIR